MQISTVFENLPSLREVAGNNMWRIFKYLLFALVFTLQRQSTAVGYPLVTEGLGEGRANTSDFYELHEWEQPPPISDIKSRSVDVKKSSQSHTSAESEESSKVPKFDSLFHNKQLDTKHLLEYLTLFNMLSDTVPCNKHEHTTTESTVKHNNNNNNVEIQLHEHEMLAMLDREEQNTLANIFHTLLNQEQKSNIMKIESKVDKLVEDSEKSKKPDEKEKPCSNPPKIKPFQSWFSNSPFNFNSSSLSYLPKSIFPFYEGVKLPPRPTARPTDKPNTASYAEHNSHNKHKNFSFLIDNDPYVSDSDLLTRILQIIKNFH